MYSIDYFIKKFEAIPEENWCVETFGRNGIHCAFGHCGPQACLSNEGKALTNIAGATFIVLVNDGHNENYQQSTPKQRILAALSDIKATISAVVEANQIVSQQTTAI